MREFKEVHVVGNVVNTRDKVYRALNVRSDIEFYRKLLWAEDVAPSYKLQKRIMPFTNHYLTLT